MRALNTRVFGDAEKLGISPENLNLYVSPGSCDPVWVLVPFYDIRGSVRELLDPNLLTLHFSKIQNVLENDTHWRVQSFSDGSYGVTGEYKLLGGNQFWKYTINIGIGAVGGVLTVVSLGTAAPAVGALVGGAMSAWQTYDNDREAKKTAKRERKTQEQMAREKAEKARVEAAIVAAQEAARLAQGLAEDRTTLECNIDHYRAADLHAIDLAFTEMRTNLENYRTLSEQQIATQYFADSERLVSEFIHEKNTDLACLKQFNFSKNTGLSEILKTLLRAHLSETPERLDVLLNDQLTEKTNLDQRLAQLAHQQSDLSRRHRQNLARYEYSLEPIERDIEERVFHVRFAEHKTPHKRKGGGLWRKKHIVETCEYTITGGDWHINILAQEVLPRVVRVTPAEYRIQPVIAKGILIEKGTFRSHGLYGDVLKGTERIEIRARQVDRTQADIVIAEQEKTIAEYDQQNAELTGQIDPLQAEISHLEAAIEREKRAFEQLCQSSTIKSQIKTSRKILYCIFNYFSQSEQLSATDRICLKQCAEKIQLFMTEPNSPDQNLNLSQISHVVKIMTSRAFQLEPIDLLNQYHQQAEHALNQHLQVLQTSQQERLSSFNREIDQMLAAQAQAHVEQRAEINQRRDTQYQTELKNLAEQSETAQRNISDRLSTQLESIQSNLNTCYAAIEDSYQDMRRHIRNDFKINIGFSCNFSESGRAFDVQGQMSLFGNIPNQMPMRFMIYEYNHPSLNEPARECMPARAVPLGAWDPLMRSTDLSIPEFNPSADEDTFSSEAVFSGDLGDGHSYTGIFLPMPGLADNILCLAIHSNFETPLFHEYDFWSRQGQHMMAQCYTLNSLFESGNRLSAAPVNNALSLESVIAFDRRRRQQTIALCEQRAADAQVLQQAFPEIFNHPDGFELACQMVARHQASEVGTRHVVDQAGIQSRFQRLFAIMWLAQPNMIFSFGFGQAIRELEQSSVYRAFQQASEVTGSAIGTTVRCGIEYPERCMRANARLDGLDVSLEPTFTAQQISRTQRMFGDYVSNSVNTLVPGLVRQAIRHGITADQLQTFERTIEMGSLAASAGLTVQAARCTVRQTRSVLTQFYRQRQINRSLGVNPFRAKTISLRTFGNKFPNRELPKCSKTGEPIPDVECKNTWHSQLGTRKGSKGTYSKATGSMDQAPPPHEMSNYFTQINLINNVSFSMPLL
jgi:hypothetical protein